MPVCVHFADAYCTVASQITLELPIGLLSIPLAEELIAFEEVYLHTNSFITLATVFYFTNLQKTSASS